MSVYKIMITLLPYKVVLSHGSRIVAIIVKTPQTLQLTVLVNSQMNFNDITVEFSALPAHSLLPVASQPCRTGDVINNEFRETERDLSPSR